MHRGIASPYAVAGSVLPLRLGAAGRLGDDTGNGIDPTDGLTFWLAVDPEAETGGGDEQGARWTRTGDGRLAVTLADLPHGVRVAAPGYRTVAVQPGEGRRALLAPA